MALAIALALLGSWGSVAAYGLVAGTAGVLSLRMPERHSQAIGMACLVFVMAHIVRAIAGPAAYEMVLGVGYLFIAYATREIFRRSSGRRIDWSLVLEVGAIGTALTTAFLFNPYFDVPSAKLVIIALSTAGILFVLMSDLGRRTAPITRRYLAAIVVASCMEAFAHTFPEALFSALFTAPYYPLISGLLLPERDRTLAPTHVPARRRFGLPQVALFAGTLLVSIGVATLGGAMPPLWAALAVVTTILIFARFTVLIRQRDWSFTQERELRQYGERLISLTSIEEINDATVQTLRHLSGVEAHVAILEAAGDERWSVVAEARAVDRPRRAGKLVQYGAVEPAVAGWFTGERGSEMVVPIPDISDDGVERRYFVCRTPTFLSPDTEDHFQAAATQYSLAVRAQDLATRMREQTVRYAAEEARREAQEAWEALSIGSHEVAVRVRAGTVTASTPHAEDILGLEPLGMDRDALPFLSCDGDDGERFENPQRPGQWLRVDAQVVADGSEVFTIRDVTAEVVVATTDAVTGLAAQSTLEALDADDGGGRGAIPGAAVHLIDFGSIDRVREQHGRAIGDQALRALSERVQDAFRRNEDHFWRGDRNRILVATSGPLDNDELERRRRLIAEPFAVGGNDLEPVVTIATIDVDDEYSVAATLQRLQIALNHGVDHTAEGGGVVRFTAELYAKVERRWRLERDFKKTSSDPGQGGFTVHYQPLVSAEPSETPVAVEALARWAHPDLGPVSPGEFIPIAEDMGMIDAIDTFVLNRVLNDIEAFRRLDPDFLVHVNLSPAGSLTDKFRAVRNTVLVHGADKARSLVVEVTESAIGVDDHDDLRRAAQKLRDLGVGIAVDDFGTGESNYDRIDSLPFTEVKLAGTISSATDPVFIGSIVNNFQRLDLLVVAENVEDLDQLTRLRDAGVDIIQGFYYSRPTELRAVLPWIEERLAGDDAGRRPQSSSDEPIIT